MSFRELTGRASATFPRTHADTNFTCSSLMSLGRQVCREGTAPGRPLHTGVLARAGSGPQLPFPGHVAHTCTFSLSLTHKYTSTHAHTHNSGSHNHTLTTNACSHSHLVHTFTQHARTHTHSLSR